MYDPRVPNVYQVAFKAKQQLAMAEAAAKPGPETQSPVEVVAAPALPEAMVALPAPPSLADMTPEDMRKQRLAMSARLGIRSAIDQEREEHEAAVKERKVLGVDSAGRAGRFLKLMGVEEGKAIAGDGLAGHLVMQTTATGANTIVQSSAAPKVSIKGRPTATLLLRNFVSAAPSGDEGLVLDMQTECAKHGVVKAARSHRLVPLPAGFAEEETLRVLIRYDNVASAFKGAEALNGRVYDGRPIVVSFFPTGLMDKGEFGPAPDESRLGS